MKTHPHPLAILCLLTLASVPCARAFAEETLGRLFFTPEKRQVLDYQRQFHIQEKQQIPDDPMFTVNGVVTRSSGKQTIWINGIAHDDREASQAVTVAPNRTHPGKIVVQPESGPAASIAVGDTVNRTTGAAAGLLQGGRISIRSSKLQ